MILVVGATGNLGSAICRKLVAKGVSVAGLVRSTSSRESRERLKRMGVDAVEGDLRDRASLAKACRGRSVVISTATAMMRGDTLDDVDGNGTINLIAAAEESKVAQFIFTSFHGMGGGSPLERYKRQAESRLVDSRIAYTILRPSFFYESWVAGGLGFDPAKRTFKVLGTGESKISYIALDDVADVAAAAAGNPDTYNKVYELGGDDPLSQLDIVAELWRLGITDLKVEEMSLSKLEQDYQSVSDSDPKAESLAALFLQVARGRITGGESIFELLGRRPTSIRTKLASFVMSSLAKNPPLSFHPDDVIVAFGNLKPPRYRHVPYKTLKALGGPDPKSAFGKAVDAVKDAMVATFNKGGAFDLKTAYLNMAKLVDKEQPAIDPEAPAPGNQSLGWQLVVADVSGALHFVDKTTLDSCTEFQGGPSENQDFVGLLDELVLDGAAVAWIPATGNTGGVCFLLNLAALHSPDQSAA